MARTFVKGSDLASLTIQTGNLADGAITTLKIANSNVTTDKLNNAAVTTDKLANDAVTTAKILDAQVTLAKMAEDSVDASKIVTGAVGTDELAALSVTTAKLADDAVTSIKILDGQVLTAKLADNAVTPAKSDLSVAWNFADLRGTLGADLNANSQKIINLADPVSAQDAATKNYVDGVAQGLDVKASCDVIAKSNITLSGTQTIDGVPVTAGMRVLVAAQTNGVENGIYVVAAGAWARALDLAAGANAAGAFTFVERGTEYADSGWVCTSDSGDAVVGTDDLVFSQFSGAGQITAGLGLEKVGNTLNVLTSGAIFIDGDNVALRLSGATPGLIIDGFDNGLKVRLDNAATGNIVPSINPSAQGLSIKVDNASIEGDPTAGASLGRLRLKDLGVTTAKLADNAVTTLKIGASQVTNPKLADSSVSMSKLDAGVKQNIGKFDRYQSGTLTGTAPFSITTTDPTAPQTDNAALLVFVNGVMRTKGIDYTLADKVITFDAALGQPGDDYAVYYGIAD